MIKRALLVWGVICIASMVSASGSGWMSAVHAAVLPQAHDFGPQYINATPATSTFTISNSGTSPLTVQSITLSGTDPGAFSVVSGTCATLTPTIEPGGNCTVLASFVPVVAGTMSATIDIATDDLATPQVSVSLSGTGVLQYYALNVHLLGDGSGVVHSQPLPDLSCSSGICSRPYAFGTVVSLTAQPDLSSLFAGWNGCDNVSGTVCTVSLNRARDVSVSFNRDMSLANYLWMKAGPNAGTISTLAISPVFAADRTIFAGTPGGVFRSTSAGASWTSVNNGLASLSIRHVAVSPGFAVDGTVYAATASGLFVSQDDGSVWSPVGNGITSLDVTAVALSPGFLADQTLYAGTPAGIFRSTDGGRSWSPVTAGVATPSIRAIALSPAYVDDGILVVATTAGVYLSSNRGETWALVGNGLASSDVLAVAVSPAYVSDATVYAGTALGGVYRFDPPSGEWIVLGPGTLPSRIMALAISPGFATDQTVYAGTESGVYRTTDAGSSWTEHGLLNWGSRSVAALAVSPGFATDQMVYAGTSGSGILLSNDAGSFWFVQNTGMVASQVKAVAYSPAYDSDQTAFAAVTGGVYRTTNRGATWLVSVTGIDDMNLDTVAVSPLYASDSTVFAGGSGGVYRSVNGGVSWSLVKGGIAVRSLALSPAYGSDRIIYAGTAGSGIFRSSNGGDSWDMVNDGLGSQEISTVTFSPAYSTDGTVFAATGSGVYRLANGSGWEPLSAGKVPGGDSQIRCLVVSPDYQHDTTLYAGTAEYGILFTSDGGLTWTPVSSGLTNLDVQSLAISRSFATDRVLFAATAGGVFRTTTAGTVWVPYSNGLDNPDISAIAVSPVYVNDQQVFAGSNGSGISRLVISEPEIAVNPTSVQFGTIALPGASTVQSINLANTGVVDLAISAISLSGADSTQFALSLGSCPSFSPTLTPGTSCTVNLSFVPSAIGSKMAELLIASDAKASPLKSVILSGTAIDPPPIGTIQINAGASVTVSPEVVLALNAFDTYGTVVEMRFSNNGLTWSDWQLYGSSADWTLSLLGGDGSKTVFVQYRDNAANVSQSSQASIILESTAPIAIITAMPAPYYNAAAGFFEFDANEPATFSCQIDEEPWTSCTSPFVFSGRPDGAHSFGVRAIDTVGNLGMTASYSWIIDTITPDTAIDATPPALSRSSSAGFVFSSSESGATFQCKLDTGTWAACLNPYTLTGLPAGSHSIAVRAQDLSGNLDATPASYSWSIDLTPPTTTLTGRPANPTNLASGSFTFSADEPDTSFACSLDGAAWTPCTSPFSVTGLAEGSHLFSIRATDLAGNIETAPLSYSWSVDLTPPISSISGKPANPSPLSNATFTFGANETGATFECSLDGGAWALCTSPTSYPALADVAHTFSVRAHDPAGNSEITPPAYSWSIDTVPPDTSITAQPSNPANSVSATFSFTATEAGGTFQCSIDSGGWLNCASPFTVNGLANGSHTFSVRGADVAGNVDATPASYTWSVDATVSQSVVVQQTGGYFTSISTALGGVPAGSATVLVQSVDFVEDVIVNRCGETITLRGGYLSDFSAQTGMTTLYGSMNVACGTLIVDGFVIR